MVDGRLQVSGQSEAAASAEKLEWKRQEEMTDALGNVVRAWRCLLTGRALRDGLPSRAGRAVGAWCCVCSALCGSNGFADQWLSFRGCWRL